MTERQQIATLIDTYLESVGIQHQNGPRHGYGLAGLIVQKLQLQPEWGLLDHTDSGAIYDTQEEALQSQARYRASGETLKTRLVTQWQTPTKPPYCNRCGAPHTSQCLRKDNT